MKGRRLVLDLGVGVAVVASVGCASVEDWRGGTEVTDVVSEGAVSFDFPQSECNTVPAAHHTIPADREPILDSGVYATVKDGRDGATVQCTIASQGDGAVFDGLLALGGETFHAVGSLQPSGDDEYLGSGTIEYSSPAFGDLSSALDACSIAVTPQSSLTMRGSGTILATFACPSMDAGDSTSEVSQCAIAGSFAFASCDG